MNFYGIAPRGSNGDAPQAEMTAEFVQVKINVILPGGIKRFEEVGADGTALGTA